MARAAQLLSIETLPPMRGALIRLRARLPEILDAMERETERANRILGEYHHGLDRRVRHWQQVVEAAENEEEKARAQRALDEIEARLRELKLQLRTLRELLERYRAQSRRAHTYFNDATRAATDSLASTQAAALAYLALAPTLDGGAASPIAAAAAPAISVATAAAVSETTLDAAKAHDKGPLPTLPAGFEWVSLDQLELVDLPERADFKKVSYEDMCRGLELLHTEMVPLFRQHPAAGRDVFEDFDRRHGRISTGLVHPRSLANLYDKFFFGHEHIRVVRARGHTNYVIENGRHRVRIARDLGLKHVPAQVVG